MVEYAEYEDGSRWTPDSGNFIPWTSKNGLNDRASTFMPEFGKDVSYSDPGGTSFGRNTEAFSNSVMSQALDSAQKADAKAHRLATAESERISNPDTYEAPESFHLGEIVGADTIDEKWDPEKWKDPDKRKQLLKEIDTFKNEHGVDNLSKEESYELGKMYAAAAFPEDQYSTQSKKYLDRAAAMDKADEEKSKEKVGSSTPTSGSRFTADMKGEAKVDTTPSETFEDVKNETDEKWDPDTWDPDTLTALDRLTHLPEEAGVLKARVKDIVEKAKSGELPGALLNAVKNANKNANENLRSGSVMNEFINDLVQSPFELVRDLFKGDLDTAANKKGASFPDTPTDNSDWEEAKSSFDAERAKEKAEEEKAKKVDTTPSKTFEDVKNEFKDESKNEFNDESKKDPLPNVEPKDYTDYKPEFRNDSTNIADIKKAAEQTGADPETVKAIAGAPKFIQTIESKLGDLLLKMGRRAARYNPLTLAVALYESVKNGEGMEKSIDKAIDALGLERDSMSQDEYDALYKEIEGIRSSIDRGDFKISLAGGRGTAATSADATPTDFFDGLLNTDKTDYSGYNAGLKAETASDKNTKEIIVRVYKKDPVLRLLKC